MNTTTREEWLASLKYGDRVATHHRYAGYRLYTVDRRTPSGQIIMASGERYDKNGIEIGRRDKWDSNRLEEVTPEVLADIEHRRLVSSVNHRVAQLDINRLRLMSDEALSEIDAVLKKYTKNIEEQ